MTDHLDDAVEFDEIVTLALAELTRGPEPPATLRAALLARVTAGDALPPGFSVRSAAVDTWRPHPVPGIRMQVLSINERSGYATLLLDVQPGTRFPPHFHDGDEECFVVSGSIVTLGRRLGPGEFIHADAGTAHSELYTEEGARVLLVMPPEDYMRGA